MTHRRTQLRFQPGVPVLERRELLSRDIRLVTITDSLGGQAAIHPLVALQPSEQHQGFINVTNNRRSIAGSVTHRVNEAFQAFAYHVLNVPLTISGAVGPVSGIPVGTTPSPPTLSNQLALLDQQVAQALATRELDTTRVLPSLARGPKFTPLAKEALIPYAELQINALGQELTANPPRFNPDGSLADQSALTAVNTAYDAILDAVAENAVHPKLFRAPSDFYVNPATNFTIQFAGDPVSEGPGFYTHGPGGILLRPGSARLRR